MKRHKMGRRGRKGGRGKAMINTTMESPFGRGSKKRGKRGGRRR